MHMSISSTSGARELQKLPRLKYYYALKEESRFTLCLDAVKITNYIEKCFK